MPKNTKNVDQPKGPRQRSGFVILANSKAYEAFRSRAMVFLVLYNLTLLFANVCLALRVSIGPHLVVACILGGALGIYAAIQFSESLKQQFQDNPTVQKTIARAKERFAEPELWPTFFETLDGRLFFLALLQLVVAVVQFWYQLHSGPS